MRTSPVSKLFSLGALLLLGACFAVPLLGNVQIPPGMRALVIHVDSGVFFAVGDRVDLLVTDMQGETSPVIKDTRIAAVSPSSHLVTFLVSPDVAKKTAAIGDRAKFGLRRSHHRQ